VETDNQINRINDDWIVGMGGVVFPYDWPEINYWHINSGHSLIVGWRPDHHYGGQKGIVLLRKLFFLAVL
jgi:hypothetical protein